MSRLAWQEVGTRTFETGVDRGVLYLAGSDGVPWSGLVSVTEQVDSSGVRSSYLDGVKYIDSVTDEEFKAKISAITYPEQFEECDGTQEVSNGLFVTHQKRKAFGLSYRTVVGNDVDGVDYAYKLHLVYNALAAPSEVVRQTLSNEVEPHLFGWDIFTKPPTVEGFRPTSHFTVDSRNTPSELLNQVEDILYGTVGEAPRLPSPAELLFLFTEYQATSFDAGYLGDTYYSSFDAGTVGDSYDNLLDGGSP